VCKYDKESNNLTIEPKKDIENLFDKKGNINITAIVGENGSGKSYTNSHKHSII
jgi:ABC-type dipeptide/oligopeptide/nickel transport system ATPase component